MSGGARQGRPIVGILGGMGPEATVDLMRRVIAATPAADDEDHVHLIVDQNPQVPSRIKALIDGTGESPAAELRRMARGLTAMGAGALAMPCNTAHVWLDDVRAAAAPAPVLDMVGLTAARLGAMVLARGRVGMLASSAVRIAGLYDAAFARHGLETAFPARQAEVMEIIRAVKRGAVGPAERRALADIAQALMADGADVLLVACTELSVVFDALPAGAPAHDAMDVLAEEIVAFGNEPGSNAATGSPAAENQVNEDRPTKPTRETHQ